MPRSVPLHRSLTLRLLATSVLVAVCSIAATTWLAVKSTSHAIQHEQSQTLSDDAAIYDTLLGYAAGHRNWDTVGATVTALAGRTGRQIILTTPQRRLLADSTRDDRAPLPADASEAVDPLAVDPSLTGNPGTDLIDPRAVGPYQLTPAERGMLDKAVQSTLGCLQSIGLSARTTISANGRPTVVQDDINGYDSNCIDKELLGPTQTEAAALQQLDGLVDPCLKRQQLPPVLIGLDYAWTEQPGDPAPPQSFDQSVENCIQAGRREQLTPYVAPTALLFVTDEAGAPATDFDLSRANALRIAEVAALVMVVTVTVTVLMATRLIAPLRTLTEAAEQHDQPHARVPVGGSNEIGRLAAAFNDLSERRERLEEQREAMVRDVAHELRTPLGNIRGWLEAVEDGVVVADRTLTSRLLREALLLQHIIDDLRDLAAGDADTFRLHIEPTQVREVLDWAVQAHRAGADAAEVTLSSWIDGDPGLPADPLRLRQAVGNLVSNAVRHTPPGGSVTVAALLIGSELLIEVTDTGSGISPEDLPYVFDRFWRAEKSRNRRTGGSGLGLAIVRQLVQAHSGTVTVTSAPGAGSTFTLHLPVPGPR